MAFNEQIAERIRKILSEQTDQLEEKRMFGGLCFMVNDKMCIGVESNRIMVRFDPTRSEEVFNQEGCYPMDFTKKVMKGFAFVDVELLNTKKQLFHWINIAMEYNKIAKASKKKKK